MLNSFETVRPYRDTAAPAAARQELAAAIRQWPSARVRSGRAGAVLDQDGVTVAFVDFLAD